MKTFTVMVLAGLSLALGFVSSVNAAGFEFKPYGYLKGDFTYTSNRVLSFGKPGLSGPQVADTGKAASFGVSTNNTRFGFKGMTTTNDIEVGGKMEMDLFTGAGIDANAKPRIRLAYAWFASSLFEIRVGQQWDLFSPNAPRMNSASSLYYAGNLGTRRPQFQFSFFAPEETTAPIVQVALCEAAKETDGLGADNFASFPMFQGRASIEMQKKYSVGVSFAHANYDPNPSLQNDEYTTFGYGMDYDLRFHNLFSLKGEINTGYNLANSNFSAISGAGSKTDKRGSVGFWVNAMTKPFKHFNFSACFGMDRNTSDKINAGSPTRNMVYYGDMIFPLISNFSLEFEVGQIETKYKSKPYQSSLMCGMGGKFDF